MLAGDLSEFTLQDIFQLLGLTRKTGALRIAHEGGEGQVLVHEGNVCFAVADGERLPLAASLVTSGLVDADALSEAIDAHRADGPMPVAAALLGRDDVDGPAVDAAVHEQVTDALFVLLQASSGTFEFDHRAGLAEEWPREPVAGDALLEEARKRLERWDELRERVPGPQSRVALAPNPPGDGPVEIDREAWRLLVLVDGQRTVEELANLAGAGAFAVGELLADLVDSGVIEVVADGEHSSLDQLLDSRRSLDKLSRLDGGRGRTPAGARSGDSRSRVAGGSAESGDRPRGAAASAARPAGATGSSKGAPGAERQARESAPATATGTGGEEARGVVLNSLPPDDADPEEASRRAIADTRAAAFRDQGPQQDPAQRHRSPDATTDAATDTGGDGQQASSAASAAGQESGAQTAPTAQGHAAPKDGPAQGQSGPEEAKQADDPTPEEASATAGEEVDADAETEEQAPSQDEQERSDDQAAESPAQSAGAGAAAGATSRRSSGRLDRAQVARELASLGLDDNGGGGRARSQARNSEGSGAEGAPAGGSSGDDGAAAQPGSGSTPAAATPPQASATHPASAGRPSGTGGQAAGAAAAAEALPVEEETPEAEESPESEAAPEPDAAGEKDEHAASLRRDERVDRGLLLRLIDGVQDA